MQEAGPGWELRVHSRGGERGRLLCMWGAGGKVNSIVAGYRRWRCFASRRWKIHKIPQAEKCSA